MPGVVVKDVPRSVEETVARLTELVTARGMTVFAVIDHEAAARAAGLDLPPTRVVVFGSPAAGTPVMSAAPLAALDLPLKVLVWAGGAGTRLAYTAPAELGRRYALPDALWGALAGIDALTEAVVSAD